MKTFLIALVAIALFISSCNAQSNSNIINSEVEKWKLELLLNGEVGPKCSDDYQKWSKENPNYYYGMQEIKSSEFDFNADGIKDALFYFPAENCVGGNGYGSDFAMLVYSYKDQFLTNKNLTKIIEKKIESALAEQNIYNVYSIVLNYSSLGKTINGSFSAWVGEDPHCCPSSKGTFTYNPVKFNLSISITK